MNPVGHIFLFVAMCFLVDCGVWARDGVHAELVSQVLIDGHYVMLKDVAKLSGADAATLDAVGRLKLTTVPGPGFTERLSRREIARLVRQSGLQDVTFDGALAVSIEAGSTPFDMDRIVSGAKEFLSTKISQEAATFQVALAGDVPQIRLPHGQVGLQNRAFLEARPTSQMTVWVDVSLDGEFYQAVPVRFKVLAMRTVLVAQANMTKGQIPTCANLTVEDRDIAALDGSVLPVDCKLIKGRLVRNKTAGDALLASELEPVPAVNEGDVVILAVVDGSVALESHAVALTDGQVGQRIPVRATIATEPVDAMVVGPGVVKVTER